MVQYKKFQLDSLFDIHPTKPYKMTNRKLMNNDGKVAVLTNTSINNGVGGWSDLDPTETNSLPMITFSDTTTGPDTLFVQTKPYIGYSHVQGMYSKIDHHWTDLELLYVVVAIKAGAGTGWSYATKFNRKQVSNLGILLPVTSSGQPDFEYMTARIRELEAERIRELEAYLGVTGLDDTTLSASEAQALTQKVKWKKFRVGDLFEKADAKFTGFNFDVQHDVSKIKDDEFNLPVVSVLSDHNGIMYYGRSSDWSYVNNSIDIVQNGVKATGSVFYQSQYTSSFRDAYLVKFKDRELTQEESLYMVGALKAVLPKSFSRERLATWTRVKNTEFLLPVTPDDQIDFNYMQNYISAMEKQTIKGVVEYKDRVIKETKKVVGK